jgi:hypothetical protein
MPARLCNVACVQYGRITGESSSLMAARAVRSSVVAFWQRGGFLLQNFQGAGNGKYRLREGEHERPGHGEPASELRAAGCEKLYAEKEPGAKTDRPQLAKCLRALVPAACWLLAASTGSPVPPVTLFNVLEWRGQRSGRIPLIERHLGGHRDAPRPADAHRARRPCRV